jgi:hypothetical protein
MSLVMCKFLFPKLTHNSTPKLGLILPHIILRFIHHFVIKMFMFLYSQSFLTLSLKLLVGQVKLSSCKIWGFHGGDYEQCRFLTAATWSCWFLARGFFCLEDGGDTFLRNVGSHEIYTAPHPRRRNSSSFIIILVKLKVLTAVVVKTSNFWDITPCSPLKANRRLEEHVASNFMERTVELWFMKNNLLWCSHNVTYTKCQIHYSIFKHPVAWHIKQSMYINPVCNATNFYFFLLHLHSTQHVSALYGHLQVSEYV